MLERYRGGQSRWQGRRYVELTSFPKYIKNTSHVGQRWQEPHGALAEDFRLLKGEKSLHATG